MKISGRVQQGLKKGRKLGFPTINLPLESAPKELEHGIYAVRVMFNGNTYGGAMHYGPRKTINEGDSLEIYIFDFNENAYGLDVEVEIVGERIREVQDFEDLESLVDAIEEDVGVAREMLA